MGKAIYIAHRCKFLVAESFLLASLKLSPFLVAYSIHSLQECAHLFCLSSIVCKIISRHILAHMIFYKASITMFSSSADMYSVIYSLLLVNLKSVLLVRKRLQQTSRLSQVLKLEKVDTIR
jgi:hypothetical protein